MVKSSGRNSLSPEKLSQGNFPHPPPSYTPVHMYINNVNMLFDPFDCSVESTNHIKLPTDHPQTFCSCFVAKSMGNNVQIT